MGLNLHLVGGGADLVDRQIRAVVLLFLGEAQADGLTHHTVDQQGADDGNRHAEQGAEQLADEADAAHAPQGFTAEDPCRNPAPGAAQAVQRPDTEHVVELGTALQPGEDQYEDGTGHAADDQGAHRMHQIGAGADGDQAGQRPVVDEAGVILAEPEGNQGATDHGHQGVDGDQTADGAELLGGHHVEAEPADDQDPGAEGQHGDVGGGETDRLAVADPAAAGTEQGQGDQADPAAHGMHHHGAGEIMERGAEGCLQPLLYAKAAIPGDPFEQRVNQADDQKRADQQRIEAGPLGDATTDDGRDGRREGEQEEELGQFETVIADQAMGAAEEALAIGDAVAEEKVGQGGDGKIGDDLDQGVDLILAAHRSQLKERKT